jgi:hypothetical protein
MMQLMTIETSHKVKDRATAVLFTDCIEVRSDRTHAIGHNMEVDEQPAERGKVLLVREEQSAN